VIVEPVRKNNRNRGGGQSYLSDCGDNDDDDDDYSTVMGRVLAIEEDCKADLCHIWVCTNHVKSGYS